MAENDEELKRVKEESEKASLKLNIQKTKIKASSPITSWQIEVGNVEAVIDFIFSKIIADVDCSHEVKRCLPLGRKAMTHRQCIKKHRDHSANKGPYSQSYDFSSGHVGI